MTYNKGKPVSPSCIDQTLVEHASRAVQMLRAARLKVVLAESCTAGLVSTALSQGEGATEAFTGGFVVYTKPQKHLALGIDLELLDRLGAVSADTAAAMVEGALARSNAQVGVSITGVLGPSEDEDGNPVGLIYIASACKGSSPVVEKKQLPKASSDDLRRQAVLLALKAITDRISDQKQESP